MKYIKKTLFYVAVQSKILQTLAINLRIINGGAESDSGRLYMCVKELVGGALAAYLTKLENS